MTTKQTPPPVLADHPIQAVTELRALWQRALSDKTAGVAADDVLDRLERKYQAKAIGEGDAT